MRNRRLFQILWSVLWVSQVGSAAQQLSNTPRQDFWVTDGAVNAIAVTNDRVFIGDGVDRAIGHPEILARDVGQLLGMAGRQAGQQHDPPKMG